jgi:hypothetical protein
MVSMAGEQATYPIGCRWATNFSDVAEQIHEAFLDVGRRRFVRRILQGRCEEARDVLVANLRSHDLGDHPLDALVAAKTNWKMHPQR